MPSLSLFATDCDAQENSRRAFSRLANIPQDRFVLIPHGVPRVKFRNTDEVGLWGLPWPLRVRWTLALARCLPLLLLAVAPVDNAVLVLLRLRPDC